MSEKHPYGRRRNFKPGLFLIPFVNIIRFGGSNRYRGCRAAAVSVLRRKMSEWVSVYALLGMRTYKGSKVTGKKPRVHHLFLVAGARCSHQKQNMSAAGPLRRPPKSVTAPASDFICILMRLLKFLRSGS